MSTGTSERDVAAVLEGWLRGREERLLSDHPLPLDGLQSARETVYLPVPRSQLDLLVTVILQSDAVPPPVHWREDK